MKQTVIKTKEPTIKSGAFYKTMDIVNKTILRLILITFSMIVLYPLVWNLLASFKTNTEFLTDPWTLPSGIHFQNYINAFTKSKMADYFLNSIFVVVVSTCILLFFVIPMAYVLVRYSFKGSKIIMNIYMACIFIQTTYIMVPLFLQMNKLYMLDNRLGLCLVYAVTSFPFAIFLLTGFIRAIPIDYEQAAMIDGCTNVGIITRIIIPMAKPGIVTVTMLSAMGYWNEYPLALVLISSDEKKTLPVGLANLYEVQRYATDWGALFAALIIILVPTILIFIVGQKQLLQGIGAGGLKG